MRLSLHIVAVILAGGAASQRATAQAGHQISGNVWTELEPGKVTRGAGATVYIWPDDPAVKSVIDSACAAWRADRVAWLSARTALTDPEASTGGTPRMQQDVAILRTLIQLPHAVSQADSVGHFVVDSVPVGGYWLEAEMMLNGEPVQWWKKTTLIDSSILKRPLDPEGVRVGPREYHQSQFCTDPEPGVGAALTDNQPSEAQGHVYTESEVDRVPQMIGTPELPQLPSSMVRARGAGSITMQFVISASGDVVPTSIEVVGVAEPELVTAVRRSLLSTHYSPAFLHGRPVPVHATTTFQFQAQTRRMP